MSFHWSIVFVPLIPAAFSLGWALSFLYYVHADRFGWRREMQRSWDEIAHLQDLLLEQE